MPVGFRLSNPILNCARHSKIVRSVASTPKAIEIQIQDHGAGISEAELARAGNDSGVLNTCAKAREQVWAWPLWIGWHAPTMANGYTHLLPELD